MQVGILTYYGVHNHGAVLQANALKVILEEMGNDVSFLSFERSYEYLTTEQTKKYKLGINSIPYYLKFVQKNGMGNFVYNLRKHQLLKKFCSTHFRFVFYSAFTGDVTVVGSDEVFSLEVGYNPFMYGIGLKSRAIVSYAGSFGPSTLDEIKKKKKMEQIHEGLNRFKAISVRDQNSQDIIKNISQVIVPLVCDPVLLYGYEEEQIKYLPEDDNYIAIYAYDHRMNEPEVINAIKSYAKKNNLKIYSIGYYHKWADKNINVDSIELLGWIRNSKLVITDTFHGTIFSIICNTPMLVKIRKSNKKKLSYLLSEYGLKQREIDSFNNLEILAKNSVDFEVINSLLREKRTKSLEFLKDAIYQ